MDNIRQKLDLIDKKLHKTKDFHSKITETCPLFFAASGLIVGILIQSKLPGADTSGQSGWAAILWLIPLAFFAGGAVLYFVFNGSNAAGKTNPARITAYASLICFVCLGGIRLISHYRAPPFDVRNFVGEQRQLATIRGMIITSPYTSRNKNWAFSRFSHTDPACSFYLKLDRLKTPDGWAKAAGTIRVQINEPAIQLAAGDRIQAYCWLSRFKKPTNPGQFNIAGYMAGKKVFIAAFIGSKDAVKKIGSGPEGIFLRLKSRLRQTAAAWLHADMAVDEPNMGLLEALLLGQRTRIDSDTYHAFRKTGLLHFISLSGMHLGILVGIIWWLCKTAGLMKPGRAAVCMVAIAVFLLLVPPRAPTLRAAIICFVFCVSFFFRRKSSSLNTLSLAAIILLLMRPTGLFEAGWQLSFASVLGILLFTDRIHFFLYEMITDKPLTKETIKSRPFFRIIAKPGPYLLRLFSIGLAAWLGGAGILLYHFYTINPLTSVWTVIAFPLVAGILTFGFLKIVLSFLLPSATMVLGAIAAGLADLLIWIVKLFAHLDISQILIGHVPITMIILYYCFILFAFFVYFRRPLIKKAISVTMILVVIAFVGVTKWQRTYRDNLVLTVLDVGHGQAILAQLPGKTNILFDAGSLYKTDIGTRAVNPFLDYSGINKIDAIIVSHNDVDHINGIPEIVEHCKVGGVYANDDFFDKTDRWGTAKFLEESLNKKGFEIQPLGKGLNFSSKAKVKILWPTEQVLQNEKLGDNDRSSVVLIEFAGEKILLCSDIERFAQTELLQLLPDLRAEVVIAPHHGSNATIESGFLAALQPETVICSCGKRRYQNRHTDKRKDDTKTPRVFYTFKAGAVSSRITQTGSIKTAAFTGQK